MVTPDERFKAKPKPVLDIVVYWGGDAISGSLFAMLTEGIGFGLAAVSLISAAISAIWTFLAIALGRKYERR